MSKKRRRNEEGSKARNKGRGEEKNLSLTYSSCVQGTEGEKKRIYPPDLFIMRTHLQCKESQIKNHSL